MVDGNYDEEYEDAPPDALPGHVSTVDQDPSGLGDVVLSLIGEVCKLQVALRELDPDEWATVDKRLQTLRSVVDGLPQAAVRGRRPVKVVGFKPPGARNPRRRR